MSSASIIKSKNERRLRRKRHIRRGVFGTATKPRLTVSRSHKHISCQLVDDQKGVTLASVSTLEKEVRQELQGKCGNCKAAAAVGKLIAEKGKSLGVGAVQFDRNGYKFHGRLKALVESARQAGLKV
jgi:large subunit ribosomal protein L18